MGKPTLTPKPRNGWELLTEVVEHAVSGGLRRARKHNDAPSDAHLLETICQYVKDGLAEEFDVPGAARKPRIYTQKQAIELLRLGQRMRPDHFIEGRWMQMQNGQLVDDVGLTWTQVELNGEYFNVPWYALKPGRLELHAQILEATKVADGLVDERDRLRAAETQLRADFQREHDRLTAELKEAEERAKVAEAEAGRFEDASDDLTAECERLRAAGPRFAVGDRVEHRRIGGMCGQVAGVVTLYTIRWEDGSVSEPSAAVGFKDSDLQPTPDAKPAEPVWHPCSAAEARERHAAGMRVRPQHDPIGDWWLQIADGRPMYHAPSTRVKVEPAGVALELLSTSREEWLWSKPLPESEGSAGHG